MEIDKAKPNRFQKLRRNKVPQLKMYTGKILRTTVDAKEIHKFMKDNGLEKRESPHEIIRIRIYSFQIGMPPDSYKPSNLDADLLNHSDPTAFIEIFVKDLIEFSAYTIKAPKNGYTVLDNLYVENEKIKRIQKDPFKPILPIHHYFGKIKSILSSPIAVTIIVGILGIIATIVVAIIT